MFKRTAAEHVEKAEQIILELEPSMQQQNAAARLTFANTLIALSQAQLRLQRSHRWKP